MDIKETLFELVECHGPPGFEGRIAELAARLLTPLTDEISRDNLGNVIAHIHSNIPDAPTVLLDAHLDEVGIIVTSISDIIEDGEHFYGFQTLGSIDPRVLPGAEFILLTEPHTKAVVASIPPHLQKSGESDAAAKIENLYLDAGGIEVPIGTPGVFAGEPRSLGSLISAKASDNRAGFAVLLYALDLLQKERGRLPCNLIVCGSVMEEVGTRGAPAVAFAFEPDIAIAVDVTFGHAPDMPAIGSYKLGKGVCINKGPDCNRKLTEKLIETARAKEIPHQIEVTAGMSSTNATAIQIAREGARTAVLSIPIRYMHTPSEVLHPDDIAAAAKLIKEWVMTL